MVVREGWAVEEGVTAAALGKGGLGGLEESRVSEVGRADGR